MKCQKLLIKQQNTSKIKFKVDKDFQLVKIFFSFSILFIPDFFKNEKKVVSLMLFLLFFWKNDLNFLKGLN